MYNDHIPIRRADGGQAIFALNELITATRALADSLREATADLHDDLDLSVPARALLIELRKHGALTVPDLARQRGVSRQSIQVTINPLQDRGLVEASDNPAHRRSKLMKLTHAGENMVRDVMRREGAVLRELAGKLTAAEIRLAAGVVAEVQERVATAAR